MKIFFDTNVIISAFIAHGHASELFSYCLSNHKNYTSDFVLDELEKNLIKFNFSNKEIILIINFLKANFYIITNYKKFKNQISRDKDDDNILAAAYKAGVGCIITGDKDLLVLKKYKNISILAPRDFWGFEKSY